MWQLAGQSAIFILQVPFIYYCVKVLVNCIRNKMNCLNLLVDSYGHIMISLILPTDTKVEY